MHCLSLRLSFLNINESGSSVKNDRHMHSLSYRQIHTSVCYYKYSFFPISIVLWNKLPADLVLVSDLDSFKTGVSKINHTQP